jgi:hypothetical protein
VHTRTRRWCDERWLGRIQDVEFRNSFEACLIVTINDTCIGDLPLIITISDTCKNKPKRLDSENTINLSRLIVNLERVDNLKLQCSDWSPSLRESKRTEWRVTNLFFECQ